MRERTVTFQTGKGITTVPSDSSSHTHDLRCNSPDWQLLTVASNSSTHQTSELTALLATPLFIPLVHWHPVARETLFSFLSLVIFLRSRAGCRWERTLLHLLLQLLWTLSWLALAKLSYSVARRSSLIHRATSCSVYVHLLWQPALWQRACLTNAYYCHPCGELKAVVAVRVS